MDDKSEAGVWYFAFGSNMHPKTLARRSIQPQRALRARVSGWRYTNNYLGIPFWEPAFASIVKVRRTPCHSSSSGDDGGQDYPTHVHGMLYLISDKERRRLLRSEGGGGHVGVGYQEVAVECQVYGEDAGLLKGADCRPSTAPTVVTAFTLVGRGVCVAGPPSGVVPSARYGGMVCSGARLRNIDEAYCDWLDAQPAWQPNWIGKLAMVCLLLAVSPVLVPYLVLQRRRGSAGGAPRWLHVMVAMATCVLAWAVWAVTWLIPTRVFGVTQPAVAFVRARRQAKQPSQRK